MRKKLLCAILSAFLTAGMILLCAVPAAAEGEELSEVLAFSAGNIQSDGSYLYEGECFRITGGHADSEYGGIYAGNDEQWLTVKALYPMVTITDVEAEVTKWGGWYDRVGVSSGTKEQTGTVSNGTFVSVTGIASSTFSFAGGTEYSAFGDITVSYTVAEHEHDFSAYVINGDGTHTKKCALCGEPGDAEAHSFALNCKDNGDGTHTGTCVCGLEGSAAHELTYTNNGNGTHTASCKCGLKTTEGHSYCEDATDNGDGTHTGTCACGANGAQTHSLTDGVCTCGADGYLSEKLAFNENNTREDDTYLFEGDRFRITAECADSTYGFWAGTDKYRLTVEATDPNVTIIWVDAYINFWGDSYSTVGISRGRKLEDSVKSHSTAHVVGIDSSTFSFAGGSNICAFGDITVYYRVEDHAHDFSTFTYNGDGTHSKECSLCGVYGGKEEHFFAFAPDEDEDNGDGTHTGTCVCGLVGSEIHDFSDGSTCACGAESLFEKLAFDVSNIREDESYLYEGEHFRITSYGSDECGIYAGGDYWLKVEATAPNVTITRIDAVVSLYGIDYGAVGISRGRKFQTGEVRNGSTVNVLGINSNAFSFAGGSDYSYFGDVTVYYRVEDHNHDFSVDCTSVDDCIHTGLCSGCGIIGEAEHCFYFEDYGDGTHSRECSGCGHTVTELHVFDGGVCVCGAASLCEKLVFVFDAANIQSDGSYSFKSEHFGVIGEYADADGINGGVNDHWLKVEATAPNVTITRIDAVVSLYGIDYGAVGISRGWKFQNGEVVTGSTVNVLGINSNAFSFAGGDDYCKFGDITVYYRVEEHNHDFSVDCTYVDDCIHTGACSVCGIIGEAEHGFDFEDNGDGTHTGTCVCGHTVTELHVFDGGVCVCGAASLCEKLVFDGSNILEDDSYLYEGEHFRITGKHADSDGIYGGDDDYWLKVEATAPNVMITRIDAVVNYWGSDYDEAGISGGRKFQEGIVESGSTVNVFWIDSNVFSFAGGDDYCEFGDITVYYSLIHEHAFEEVTDNGDGTHTGECSDCERSVTELHVFDDGVCVCGAKSLCEKLVFDADNIQSDSYYFFEGEHFRIIGEYADSVGIYGGSDYYQLWIEAKDPNVTITRVDAVVTRWGDYYDEVGVSDGWKFQKGKVVIGSTVNVLGIDSNLFSFEGGDYCEFSDITVYYDLCEHSFEKLTDNGDGTHTGECSVCERSVTEPHVFKDGVCVCGAKSLCEKLVFDEENIDSDNSYFFEGEHFRVTGVFADSNGICGGNNSYPLRIEAKDTDVTITRVDAVVSYWGDDYDEVGISEGWKFRQGIVKDGSTVNVLGIDSDSFAFTGGTDYCKFSDITVYYDLHEHSFEKVTDNGDGTHTGECSVCGNSVTEPHVFKDGVCACGAVDNWYREDLPYTKVTRTDEYLYEGHVFKVTGTQGSAVDCLFIGHIGFPKERNTEVRIESMIKNADVKIVKVEATCIGNLNDYDELAFSSGTMKVVPNDGGAVMHISKIDEDFITISSGIEGAQCYITDIVVYYTHTHLFEGEYIDNGDGTHSRDCTVCGDVGGTTAHVFDEYIDNPDGTRSVKCACGAEAPVYTEYYFADGRKPIAGGENGLVNKRAYYVNAEGEKVELEAGLLEEDLEVTFAEWYLRTAVQFRETEDGGVNVRFVSMLDENLDDYYEAGFTYTVGGADTFDPLTTQFGNTSYITDNKTVKAGDFGLGEEYFILRDVDFAKEAVDANLEISVTPYVLLADEENYVTGEAVSFRLGDLVKAA